MSEFNLSKYEECGFDDATHFTVNGNLIPFNRDTAIRNVYGVSIKNTETQVVLNISPGFFDLLGVKFYRPRPPKPLVVKSIVKESALDCDPWVGVGLPDDFKPGQKVKVTIEPLPEGEDL